MVARRKAVGWLARVVAVSAVVLLGAQAPPAAAIHSTAPPGSSVSPALAAQLNAIAAEKASRTPAQAKINSHLLLAEKKALGVALPKNFPNLPTDVSVDKSGGVVVDVTARMTSGLLRNVQTADGKIVALVPKTNQLRVRLPLVNLEALAASPDVTSIAPPEPAQLQTGPVDSEGDTTHRANTARSTYGVDGTGITIGVLSDGVDSLATSQGAGELPTVTVLPGQAGSGDEGTAMLEIVHDIAPGAALAFATAFTSELSFAQNIRDLRAAGCDIIVDDVFYFDESPFQDGPVAQAVNDVVASGGLYFSSAGNSGNLDDGTSGVWEGDFVSGGTASVGGNSYRLADFKPGAGTQTQDPIASQTLQRRATLSWSDRAGASSNDYDLFLIAADGSTIVDASTDIQNGNDNPYEFIDVPANNPNRRMLVGLFGSTAAARFLHLTLNRGRFSAGTTGLAAYATGGQTSGHSSAAGAFSVAATPAHGPFQVGQPSGPYPGVFTAGNVSETFTSDGPRRMFYTAGGTAYTPGNFSSTGGVVRQKPDITAADGVATSVPGFQPFYGTSAAAPHAAAIAALVLQGHPGASQAQVRAALTSSAIDIEAAGWDRDTGAGIIDAVTALQDPAYRALTPARVLDTRNGTGAASRAPVAAGHSVTLQVTGRGGVPSTGVGAVVINVTATQPTAASGNITVYPNGAARPTASNLNFVRGQTVPNLVVVKTGTSGKIVLYNGSAGSVHLIGDVAGYFLGGVPTVPGSFDGLTPARILDTRTGNGAAHAAVPAGHVVSLQVAGRGGVPASGVGAVVINVTATQPTAASGSITVWPTGTARPNASNLNFVRGQTVPNLVMVKLGAGGKINLYNGSAGSVQLIGDVAGYYLAGTPTVTGSYAPLTPARVLDTRTGNGAARAAVPAGHVVTLQVTGRGGVPATGVVAVVINVTVTQPSAASGSITVWPTGSGRPTASNLNFVRGQTVPNLVVVKLGTGGKINLYNASAGTVQLIGDVAGYFLS